MEILIIIILIIFVAEVVSSCTNYIKSRFKAIRSFLFKPELPKNEDYTNSISKKLEKNNSYTYYSNERNEQPECLTNDQAKLLIENIEGLEDFIRIRYALTGATNIYPSIGSDIHLEYMNTLYGTLNTDGISAPSYLNIHKYDWSNIIKFQATEKKLKQEILHFTHLNNLDSILNYGILTKQELKDRSVSHIFNDIYRLDKVLNSISLSIGRINSKMFYKYTNGFSDKNWVILKISQSIISGPNTLSFDTNKQLSNNIYCYTNAASKKITSLSIKQRMKYSSFQSMYLDDNGLLSNDKPIDIQAEILHLNNIPTELIEEIVFFSEKYVPPIVEEIAPYIKVTVDPSAFKWVN